MNKITPLRASSALKLAAKNEAKVSATRERLANSIDFCAYNLHWNSFIFISIKNIALIYSLSRSFYWVDNSTYAVGQVKVGQFKV